MIIFSSRLICKLNQLANKIVGIPGTRLNHVQTSIVDQNSEKSIANRDVNIAHRTILSSEVS